MEPLESRQLLGVIAPDPLVSVGFVGPDLVIQASSPEVAVKITDSGSSSGPITVTGLTQQYLGTDGNYDSVQTDINNSGIYSQTFTPSVPLRDLKIQLKGSDSFLQIGDPADPVAVGRDLIISMPANTTSASLAKAGVATTSILNLDVDSVTVGRNMTITIGQAVGGGEAAVVDITNDLVGSPTQKGILTLTTYGDFPNLIGVSSTTVTGDLSVTTNSGNDFVSMIGVDVTGRLTISVGDGDNTVLLSDDFNEVVDSSLQTFVSSNPVFGDNLGDGELTQTCVQQLSDDLYTASTTATFSVTAQNLNVYSIGAGNDLVDVHDAFVIGGNLVVSSTGTGTHVIAVTNTTVDAANAALGNVTITGGNGDNLVILDSLTVSGALTVTTGTGNNVIIASPDVSGVVESAINDFVANHPGVFFDPTAPTSSGLDIGDLLNEILDLGVRVAVRRHQGDHHVEGCTWRAAAARSSTSRSSMSR